MVERYLAKVEVAGSTPVSRSQEARMFTHPGLLSFLSRRDQAGRAMLCGDVARRCCVVLRVRCGRDVMGSVVAGVVSC